ncbi:hypothetical protein L7F22_067876 [Adiantum nelumboides]|nr:hypothetical protein [Adiantum nelumboides]
MIKQENSFHSLLAGLNAGAIEGIATYPTEFVKTQAQLAHQQVRLSPSNKFSTTPKSIHDSVQVRSTHNITAIRPKQQIDITNIIRQTFQTRGIPGFYAGCIPMATGNALKAGTRFMVYDTIKDSLRTSDGKLTLPRSIFAGFCAGLAEGCLAVTPSEAIKTRMIQDAAKGDKKQFHGTLHGIRTIVKHEGISALYRGLTATMLRQGANSAVRLSSYSAIRSTYEQFTQSKMGVIGTFCAGATAGVITVYTTMPFDVIKTRMQATSNKTTLNEKKKGIIGFAREIIKNEGVLTLWAGTGPRLTRLIFSGGIAFSVYESTMNFLR